MNESFWERFIEAVEIVLDGKEQQENRLKRQQMLTELSALKDEFPDPELFNDMTWESLYQKREKIAKLEKKNNTRAMEVSKRRRRAVIRGITLEKKRKTLEELGLDIEGSTAPGVTLHNDRFYRHGEYMEYGISESPQEEGKEVPNVRTSEGTVIPQNNLPIPKDSITKRLSSAWGVLRNSQEYRDRYAEGESLRQEHSEYKALKGRVEFDEKLKDRERHEQITGQELTRSETSIGLVEKDLQGLEEAISKATSIIDGEKPEHQVHTELIISKALQVLQDDIREVKSDITFGRYDAIFPEWNQEAEEKALVAKGKLMAILMMYSLTLNNVELESCKIGKSTLKDLLSSMPQIFGFISQDNPKSVIVSDTVRSAVTLQYYEIAKKLVRVGVIVDPGHDEHNIIDLNLEGEGGLEVLLNTHAGTNLDIGNQNKDIFRNFSEIKKNPEPSPNREEEVHPTIESDLINALGSAYTDLTVEDSADGR